MALLPGFEYDIFISYRHNDNRSGWVTEFVNALQEELAATIKESLSIYFDKNPHDGLLETHNVDKSLEGKLKCLIFIPIISQTYCDTKSFAWQHEFVAFNRLAKEDQLGRDVKLSNGNVTSRILPVKIHEIDTEDKLTIEKEIVGALRAIEFIYKEAGVNRPLKATDDRGLNQNKTDYRNQVNKVANAVKDLIYSIQSEKHEPSIKTTLSGSVIRTDKRKFGILGSVSLILLISISTFFYFRNSSDVTKDKSAEAIERAEKYLEEAGRFDDNRYTLNAIAAIRKVLSKDSLNEKALFILSIAIDNPDTTAYIKKRIYKINKKSTYGYLIEADEAAKNGNLEQAVDFTEKSLEIDPRNDWPLSTLSYYHLQMGNYLESWKYSKKYEQISGKHSYLLSLIYLELGDFAEARKQLEVKQKEEEFSCGDLELYQRIFLCEGNFNRLETVTDSLCNRTSCKDCPFWILRAKMHVGKYNEAYKQLASALKDNGPITWPYPAFVLSKIYKEDSARLLCEAATKHAMSRLADTNYKQSIPYYTLSAINSMQGNYEQSIKWLREYSDRGFEQGSEWYVGHDPLFNELKANNTHFIDFIQIVQKAQIKKSTIREKLRELENQSDN